MKSALKVFLLVWACLIVSSFVFGILAHVIVDLFKVGYNLW